jgi:zinc protease
MSLSTPRNRLRLLVCGIFPLTVLPWLWGEPLVPDTTVEQGQLDNGLTYLVRPTNQETESIEFRLVVDAGSVLEADDQRGVAHLIEHLGFRSTTHYPDGSLITELQKLGSDFGPHVNAYTSFDETVFKLSLDSAQPDQLDTGLHILREWAGEVNFTPAAIAAEREIVTAEWSSRLGPNQRLLRQALPVLYPDSRYATRLPIGDLESIQSVSAERIADFYHQWYRPDNMAVIVSGPVDPAAVVDYLHEHFADLTKPTAPLVKPDLNLPVDPGLIPSVASDPELGYNVVRLIFPHDRIAVTDAASLRHHIQAKLIAHILTRRLEERKERSPVPFLLGRATYGPSLARAQEELALLALVPDGGATTGLTALVEEAERLSRFGITPDELAQAVAAFQTTADTTLAESDQKPAVQWADKLTSTWLRRDPIADPRWTHAEVTTTLHDLTPEALAESVAQLLFPARTLVRLDLAEKPVNAVLSAAQIMALVTTARSNPVESAGPAEAAPTELLTQLPPPGPVVDRIERPQIGVTELQLANGIKVVLKPTDFTATEILFSAQRPGGFLSLPAELELAAKFAPAYIGEAGLGNLRKSDLIRLLSGKRAGVSVRFDSYLDLIKGQTTTTDLETALQLIHLAFGSPRSDENAFETVLGMNQAFESNVVMNPVMNFLNEVMVRRHDDHPRAPRLVQLPEAWQQLSLDKVISAYEARMKNAAGFTFFIVGSFTEATITPLLERYLGSLPGKLSATTGPRWTDVGIRQVTGPVHEVLASSHDPKSLLIFTQQHPVETWTSRETHLLWSLGNILQRALLDQLRIEQNSVYTLQVSSTLERIPFDHYLAEIGIPCRPGDEALIAEGLTAQVERLRQSGPTPQELQQEIEFQRAKERRELTSNSDWLWKLELIDKYEETYLRLEDPDTLVDALTSEALRDAARTHLHPDRWVQYDLRPASADAGK